MTINSTHDAIVISNDKGRCLQFDPTGGLVASASSSGYVLSLAMGLATTLQFDLCITTSIGSCGVEFYR
jgi:hypothetical protein